MPTKKFMVAIAAEMHRIFKNLPEEPDERTRLFDAMIVALADVLESSNERFLRDKFFAAIYHPKA